MYEEILIPALHPHRLLRCFRLTWRKELVITHHEAPWGSRNVSKIKYNLSNAKISDHGRGRRRRRVLVRINANQSVRNQFQNAFH